MSLTGVTKYWDGQHCYSTDSGDKGACITYSRSADKRLHNTPFLRSLFNVTDRERLLNDLNWGERPVGLGEVCASELENTATGDAGENELVLQGSGDKFQLPGLLVLPDDKEVASAGLGHLTVLAKQPQDLVIAQGLGLAVCRKRGAIVGTQLRVTETARPRTDGVRLRSKELQTRLDTGLELLLGGVGPGHGNNEEESLLRGLNTQVWATANQCGTKVQETSGLILGEPAYR